MSYVDKISVDGLVYDVQDTNTKAKVNDIERDLNALEVVVDGVGAKVGSGNLSTTSQTIVGGVNENKSDIDNVNSVIGSEELATTSQTLKGAINELDSAISELGESASSGSGEYISKDWGNATGVLKINGEYTHDNPGSLYVGRGHEGGQGSVAIGNTCKPGVNTIAMGYLCNNFGYNSLCGGTNNSIGVNVDNSIVFGSYCEALSSNQFVQGKYNIRDNANNYAHIVGNGTYDANKGTIYSNAYTLDWQGNGWFAGDVKIHDGDGNEYSLLDIVQRVIALENA